MGPQIDSDKSVNIGVAAHITAASPGGPRYDGSLSPEERSSPENGVWLCQNCAKLVDNDPRQYPSDVLSDWKIEAETAAKLEIQRMRDDSQTKATLQSIPQLGPAWTKAFDLITRLRSILAGYQGTDSDAWKVLSENDEWIHENQVYLPEQFIAAWRALRQKVHRAVRLGEELPETSSELSNLQTELVSLTVQTVDDLEDSIKQLKERSGI